MFDFGGGTPENTSILNSLNRRYSFKAILATLSIKDIDLQEMYFFTRFYKKDIIYVLSVKYIFEKVCISQL